MPLRLRLVTFIGRARLNFISLRGRVRSPSEGASPGFSFSFDQDPLRILRAVRIAKERNLHIDTATREAIFRQRNRLCSVSAERIRSEFFKILSFSDAPESLKLLDELGCLSILIPETEALKGKSLESPSGLSLWQHSLKVVRWCEWSLVNFEKIFPQFHEYIKSYFEEEIEKDVDRKSLLKLAGLPGQGRSFSWGKRNDCDGEYRPETKAGETDRKNFAENGKTL